MQTTLTNRLINTLWPSGSDAKADTVYAIVDGARHEQIFSMIRATELFSACLFAGNISEAMQAAAPHIVKLTPEAVFTLQLLECGWGNSWGIFVTAQRPAGIEDVRKQLRQFLLVKGPDGKALFFRYYDPRVMRVYLPTCNDDDCRVLFSPIKKYVMEGYSNDHIMEFNRETILARQAEV